MVIRVCGDRNVLEWIGILLEGKEWMGQNVIDCIGLIKVE